MNLQKTPYVQLKHYPSPENFTQTRFAWFATFCESATTVVQGLKLYNSSPRSATILQNSLVCHFTTVVPGLQEY